MAIFNSYVKLPEGNSTYAYISTGVETMNPPTARWQRLRALAPVQFQPGRRND